MNIDITYIGTATVLLNVNGLRILTDPVLDPRGSQFTVGVSGRTTYASTMAPSFSPEMLESVDVVLLSHDQHGDNLDREGRRLLHRVGRVVTTQAGAKRLSKRIPGRVVGLRPWEVFTVDSPDGTPITIKATPARHGPPMSLPFVGHVIGFHLTWPGQKHGPLYISGDTVFYRGVKDIARREDVGTAILHVGQGSFRVTGPIRYSMDGRDAAKTGRALRAARVIPVHFDGWDHFKSDQNDIKSAFKEAELEDKLYWLPRGETTSIEV